MHTDACRGSIQTQRKHVEADKHADAEWHTGLCAQRFRAAYWVCAQMQREAYRRFNKALVENLVNAGKRVKGS
jgi:hypothetical protein